MGETVVIFKEVNQAAEETGFKIVGSPRGIEIHGMSSTFNSLEDLNKFAAAVDGAWRAHLELKPKIVMSAMDS